MNSDRAAVREPLRARGALGPPLLLLALAPHLWRLRDLHLGEKEKENLLGFTFTVRLLNGSQSHLNTSDNNVFVFDSNTSILKLCKKVKVYLQ